MSSSRPFSRGAARWVLAIVAGAGAAPAMAQAADPLLIHQDADTTIRGSFQGGANLVAERNLYWNLADRFAPSANFDSDAEWFEVYVKPGIGIEQSLGGSSQFYGKVSAVASATLGKDGFAQGNTGRVTIEEAFGGLRLGQRDTGEFDLSLGAQELKLGTGMLIANGASNGFERGAVKLGPRKAWEYTAIAKFTRRAFTGRAFFLDPRELKSNNTRTRIAGADLRLDREDGDFAGVSLIKVLQSGAPYPQAAPGGVGPPTILEGARDGLKAVTFYGRLHPFRRTAEGFYVALDGAYEWNERVRLRAWGGRAQVGHLWKDRPWRPELFYSYQTFSGDDPDTARLERFDPLNYEGSPASWATGSKSALVFINSNVQSHQLTLKLMPSPKDFLTLRTAHIRVNQLRSPIQFGQATRLDITDGLGSVISGVTKAHLANDFFVEYTRLLNRQIFLTTGISVSTPGNGIKVASGDSPPVWTGGFLNVVVNY